MAFVRHEEEKCFVDPNDGDRRVQFPSLAEEASVYLSVIVPCMNEEQRLPSMLDECLDYLEKRRGRQASFTYEVIVVDDGSTDRTSAVAAGYCRKYSSDLVRVMTLKRNRGKGGAVRMGFWVARGQYLLFADADGATRFEDFEKLEACIIRSSSSSAGPETEKRADSRPAVAIGSRAHLEKESIASRSVLRTVLMYGFHFLVWLFCVRTVKDTQCGFKLFTRPAARLLFANLHVERWAFDVELLCVAERLGIPVGEVAVQWHEVAGSKLTPWKASLQMAVDLFLIWFRYATGVWTIKTDAKID